jgi:post-segregation antitoxin (ccd killing protein)
MSTHFIHIAMERKNITIREDQSEWIERRNINLSQLVQETIDEEMGPSEEELADAYKQNADHAAETTEQWDGVSREANDHLGDAPGNE